jgi:hypothetical protein
MNKDKKKIKCTYDMEWNLISLNYYVDRKANDVCTHKWLNTSIFC